MTAFVGENFHAPIQPRYINLASLSISFLCSAGFFLPAPATAQSTSDNVIYLNQAWSQVIEMVLSFLARFGGRLV